MLVAALIAFPPVVTTRTFDTAGIFGASAKFTITRTMFPEGGMEWSEKTVWNDDTVWTDVRRYTKDGALESWTHDWKQALKAGLTEDSSWSILPSGDTMTITQKMYRNDKTGGFIKVTKTPIQAGDPSLYWWNGVTPKLGETVQGSMYIVGIVDPGKLENLKVTSGPEVTLSIKGEKVKVRRIVRDAESRSETWWVDKEGMPVKRVFWTKSESEPHRVDTLK